MAHPTPTTWTLHLAARQPKRAALAIGIILVTLWAVNGLIPVDWGTSGRIIFLLMTALLLVGSIAEFLLPVTYTLDDEGAHARLPGSHRVLPWSRVRRVYLRPHGIKLSPLTTRSWAESYRGVVLRADDRDALLETVRAWLADAGVTPEVVDDTPAPAGTGNGR